MPGGRPTKYTPELLLRAHQYVDDYTIAGDAVPQLAGFSIWIGITKETLFQWERDPEKAEFSDLIGKVREQQCQALINGGLMGEFNPTIAKVLLAKHGFSDRQEIDHTTGGESFNRVEREIIDPRSSAKDSDS